MRQLAAGKHIVRVEGVRIDYDGVSPSRVHFYLKEDNPAITGCVDDSVGMHTETGPSILREKLGVLGMWVPDGHNAAAYLADRKGEVVGRTVEVEVTKKEDKRGKIRSNYFYHALPFAPSPEPEEPQDEFSPEIRLMLRQTGAGV